MIMMNLLKYRWFIFVVVHLSIEGKIFERKYVQATIHLRIDHSPVKAHNNKAVCVAVGSAHWQQKSAIQKAIIL